MHKHYASILDENLKFEVPYKTKFDFFNRPLILQLSRWDNLKGFVELLKGFLMVKTMSTEGFSKEAKDFIQTMGLLLVGPDPRGVSDDPEAA
jgi:trehalose synthase